MDVPMASRELTPVESHANDSSLLARSGSLKQEHSKNIGLSIFLVAGHIMAVTTTLNVHGGSRMNRYYEGVKDVEWENEKGRYIIRNVPFHVYEEYTNEAVYSSDVTLKLLLLKELMEENEIPSEIDFMKAKELSLE